MNKFNIDKLQNVVLQMKLPISFDLLDSFSEEDDGKPYIVVINNIPVKIHFKRIYDFRYNKDDIAKSYFDNSQFYKMEEDRNAFLSYTEIQIWFDSKMIDSDRIDKEAIGILPNQFLEISLEYINKFIKATQTKKTTKVMYNTV